MAKYLEGQEAFVAADVELLPTKPIADTMRELCEDVARTTAMKMADAINPAVAEGYCLAVQKPGVPKWQADS